MKARQVSEKLGLVLILQHALVLKVLQITLMQVMVRVIITGFILYTFSWVGALQMWKLKKIGFHLYTGAQIFILLLPVILIPSYPFSVFSLLFTGVFIAGYALNLKFMK